MSSRWARFGPALRAASDGVREAVRLLRHGGAVLWAALFGYMLFDILTLWTGFKAVGTSPELTIVWVAYLIGQLGNLVPLPGAVGGVEFGLIGSLVLFGLSAASSTAAVLIYRAIELSIPAALGLVAAAQLAALLRRAPTVELVD